MFNIKEPLNLTYSLSISLVCTSSEWCTLVPLMNLLNHCNLYGIYDKLSTGNA
jgi:hypothetical protein